MRLPIPSQEYLRQCMSYDPETGVLTGLKRPDSHFPSPHVAAIWNAKFFGNTLGKIDREGYVLIGMDRKRYRAHRLIWMLVYGEDLGQLDPDHINRVKSDNRLLNLRKATRQQNSFNGPARANNTSGVKGVGLFKNKWRARIKVDGRSIHLGLFTNKEDAALAVRAAALAHHGEFANF